MEFSQILDNLFIKKGINSNQIHKITGLSTRLVDSYRTGEKKPGIDNLLKLADALQVSADYLMGRDENSLPVAVAKDIKADNLLLLFQLLNDEGKDFVLQAAQCAVHNPTLKQENEAEEYGAAASTNEQKLA